MKLKIHEYLKLLNQKTMSKKFIIINILLLGAIVNASAFCGFYVAKADATLFNNSSQVILVRDGNKSTITMWSDFKGDVQDFALVVPVPVVLKKNDIKVVEKSLFTNFDGYSAPRIVEYYEENPCTPKVYYDAVANYSMSVKSESMDYTEKDSMKKNKVKIEAQYSVGSTTS